MFLGFLGCTTYMYSFSVKYYGTSTRVYNIEELSVGTIIAIHIPHSCVDLSTAQSQIKQ